MLALPVALPGAEALPMLTVPVRVHLLQSDQQPSLHTTLKESDVQRIFGKVNRIWEAAGIRFEFESVRKTRAVEPPSEEKPERERDRVKAALPKGSLSATAIDVCYVKQVTPNGFYYGEPVVVKDTASLKEVAGGMDEPLPRVTAHELGHALGLAHRQDVTNLMASGTTGFALNEQEIRRARIRAEEKSASKGLTNPKDEKRLTTPADAAGAQDGWGRFIATQEGRLPIILSAPHGGQAEIPEVPPRTGQGLAKGSKGFVTSRDFGTLELTLALAAALEARTGAKPFYVAARFHRRFIDANRPAALAYEHNRAKPVYDAYHQALDRYCREVQARFGRGLLLDIHGQSTARDTVFRGTQHGRTVALLTKRFGEKAQNGPESFFGLMATSGFKVFTEDNGRERAGFTGGYIVSHYGGHEATGIDALQLEFGGDYRTKDSLEATAGKLAEAILAFARLYLPEKPVGNTP